MANRYEGELCIPQHALALRYEVNTYLLYILTDQKVSPTMYFKYDRNILRLESMIYPIQNLKPKTNSAPLQIGIPNESFGAHWEMSKVIWHTYLCW